jgi:integrase
MSRRITDQFIKNLEPPDQGNAVTYDDRVKGFGVRITANGAKAFILNYRCNGRERRYTIGRYPAWSVAAARKEAECLRKQIDVGHDPLVERNDGRSAPTLQDLWDRYEKEHLPHKVARAQADDRSMFRTYILPELGRTTKVSAVTPSEVDRLHRKIGEIAPVRANRVIEVLRKAFSLAIRWEWRPDNPCVGVNRNPEHRRTRYLTVEEIRRLSTAIDDHPERVSALALKCILLTGARRGEVLNATWDQFDLDEGIWLKPATHTNQKKPHRVPLSAPAITLLREMNGQSEGHYVFPGRDPGRPLTDLKRTWKAVCQAAGIENCRLHDLRHSFASILVSQGSSLPLIGAMLGHTQPQTTARYAHLYDEPMREAAEQVGKLLE